MHIWNTLINLNSPLALFCIAFSLLLFYFLLLSSLSFLFFLVFISSTLVSFHTLLRSLGITVTRLNNLLNLLMPLFVWDKVHRGWYKRHRCVFLWLCASRACVRARVRIPLNRPLVRLEFIVTTEWTRKINPPSPFLPRDWLAEVLPFLRLAPNFNPSHLIGAPGGCCLVTSEAHIWAGLWMFTAALLQTVQTETTSHALI